MNGQELVQKIDNLLKEQNLKRQALADFCGINSYTISDWNRHGNLPSAEVGLKIAIFLGVSIEWLFDENYTKKWVSYDDETYSNGFWLSPRAIMYRIEETIRERSPLQAEIEFDEIDENFFSEILGIISIKQIKAAYQNIYEPSLIQLLEISKKLSLPLDWLISGKDQSVDVPEKYILGVAQEYTEFLKFYNCLPESDKKEIFNFTVHLFHSRRKIRDFLLEKGIDVRDVPELIQ